MDSKIIFESFLNVIDIGTVFESINNYRKRSWKVDLREIIKYMITGKGYPSYQAHFVYVDLYPGKRLR